MKTPDEIKRGMEFCSTMPYPKACIVGCAYCDEGMTCIPALMADALAYIRELEARVAELEKPLKPMTVKEVFAVSRNEGNILWVEYREEAAVRAGYNGYYEPQHITEYSAFSGCKNVVTFYPPGAETEKTPDPAVYGIGWRCWPRRPTDEERKAAEWDD